MVEQGFCKDRAKNIGHHMTLKTPWARWRGSLYVDVMMPRSRVVRHRRIAVQRGAALQGNRTVLVDGMWGTLCSP